MDLVLLAGIPHDAGVGLAVLGGSLFGIFVIYAVLGWLEGYRREEG